MAGTNSFEKELDGKKVSLFRLENSRKTQLSITNYGCRIVSLVVPDRNGAPVDVVVGFDALEGYLTATEVYHGATIGRYANRIANGQFSAGGKTCQLATNNGPNHLHGGPGGFHTKVWDVETVTENNITLSYTSADGEEGYPGNLKVAVSFDLTEENEVVIRYEAFTDIATPFNITNHAYFNLNGQGSGTILNHTLEIMADGYTPIDDTLIPFGKIDPVEGSPFDFRKPETIGKRINEDHEQLRFGNGYDHNYVLAVPNGLESPIARAKGDKTGLEMEVYTDQPGVQFYTGNFMSGENIIKGHVPDHFRTAFCLETQHFPDSPNQPAFPSTLLQPGEHFSSETIYRFIV